MERKKLRPNVTSNILESMIEYTLMSNILDKIYEMIKKPLEYPSDDTKLNPLWHLLKIKTWETKWERVIDKTVKWLAWGWANAKIDKENITLMKHITRF
jgi:hypothetical protein